MDDWYDGGLGNGYCGYSMSNNAVEAYSMGEKPRSKWSKKEILKAIEEVNPAILTASSRLSAEELRDFFLSYAGYHHTSLMYNKTDFYSLELEKIASLSEKDIPRHKKKVKEVPVRYLANIDYIEWTGSRKWPKANYRRLENVMIEERGCFYVVFDADGKELLRKRMDSNGTRVEDIEELKRKEKLAEKRNEEYKRRIRENTGDKAYAIFEKMCENGHEISNSGKWYFPGRKPTPEDYDRGLENFFEDGEIRLVPNDCDGYTLERFDKKIKKFKPCDS